MMALSGVRTLWAELARSSCFNRLWSDDGSCCFQISMNLPVYRLSVRIFCSGLDRRRR